MARMEVAGMRVKFKVVSSKPGLSCVRSCLGVAPISHCSQSEVSNIQCADEMPRGTETCNGLSPFLPIQERRSHMCVLSHSQGTLPKVSTEKNQTGGGGVCSKVCTLALLGT